ncbi:transposase [Streptomyces sp. URMC 129]|uniref:transposase n=1 Tax=Streptomyces sp. URMC 129 TaxID=3423407 RepID=UPI003F19DC0A
MPAASPHPSGDVPSGRGCQYTSRQFAVLAHESGVRLSVGRTGQCWDNALAESFFATLEREVPGPGAWPSRAAARTALFGFIGSWYTLHRLHSSLGYQSPAEYETGRAA